MKILNINKIVGICLLMISLSISSCKDYLEVKPVSSFGPDYVFNNVAGAEKMLLGAYSYLAGDNTYGLKVSMYYPYSDDLMMGPRGDQDDRRAFTTFGVTPNNSDLAGPFNRLYRGVELANICIYHIPKMDMYTSGTESQKAQLRKFHGEALTLRAQYYLELLRNWGDLPAQFLPSSFDADVYKPKADRDIIYDQLLADLAEAAQLVPWKNQAGTTNERITQGAVRGLRARIALFRGGYSLRQNRQMERPANYKDFYKIARDECWEIIYGAGKGSHNLNPSFQAVFKDALAALREEPNGEIIWEVAMGGVTGTGAAEANSKFGYYNGPRVNGSFGNSAIGVLPTYFYSFDQYDTRRDVTCAPYDVSTAGIIAPRTLHTMVDGKFRVDWMPGGLASSAQYHNVNWPVIRYSDVLLMFAEADNEWNNGPTTGPESSENALRQVRLRAFNNNANLIGTIPTAYEDFFEAVIKERAWELGGEGIRKYDLIRWNKLGEKLNETREELTKMLNKEAPYDNLPATMYFQSNSTSLVWLNSLYAPAPASPPAGSGSVGWLTGTGIDTQILQYYATKFIPNKSELLPLHVTTLGDNTSLKQDYGY